ncbi:MAG: hypothetical protein MJ210_02310 [Alphaproteobacteria bacterium]|nr:hypothetical protein [Alphaproteobacteria bacterium]
MFVKLKDMLNRIEYNVAKFLFYDTTSEDIWKQKKTLSTLKKQLKSGKIYEKLSDSYGKLYSVARVYPEEAWIICKTALQSDKNDGNSLCEAYRVLGKVAKAWPNLTEQVVETFKFGLQTKESYSLEIAYEYLQEIVIIKPELSEKILDMTIALDDVPSKMCLYRDCTKHLPLEETIAKYPEKE